LNRRPDSLTLIGLWMILSAFEELLQLVTLALGVHLGTTASWSASQILFVAANGLIGAALGVGVLKGWPWARVLYAPKTLVALIFLPVLFQQSLPRAVRAFAVGTIKLVVVGYFLFRPKADEWFAAAGLQLRRSTGPMSLTDTLT
jgi:hypothetical protein